MIMDLHIKGGNNIAKKNIFAQYNSIEDPNLMNDTLLKQLRQWIEQDKMVKFYQSRAWQYVKQRAHERDNYECQMCRQRGLYHKVENVHHIKEVKDYPSMALLLSNTLCLCISCHNAIHGKTQYKKGRQSPSTISSGAFENLDNTESW